MKLDTREKEGSKNVFISINPNSYVSLSLLNFIFIFFKVQKLDIFSLMNWDFGLILFLIVSIIEFIIFSCVILISVFFYEKKKKVFLKAKAQYNYNHYFKLGCYIYLLVS